MKKVLIIGLAIAVSFTFGSAVMAAKKASKAQIPCPPEMLAEVEGGEDEHCFDWDVPECGKTPIKYSLDVELLMEDGEGFDEVAELSFSTTDREDGGEATDTDLCIAVSSFVVYNTMTEMDEQFIGPARIKVKAMAKGKSQNNTFTEWLDFTVGSAPVEPTGVVIDG